MNAHAFAQPANDHQWPDAYAVTLETAQGEFDAGTVLLFNSLEEPRRHDIVAVIDRALSRTLGTLVLPLPAGLWDALPNADGAVVTYRPFDGETTMTPISDLLAIHRCDGIEDDDEVPAGLLPVDEYTMEIVDGAYEGGVLHLTAGVTEGPYEGQSVPYSLDLEGEGSDEGQREFAALRRATGVLSPNDTSELHYKPFRARVDVVMGDGELRNSVVALQPEKPELSEAARLWRRVRDMPPLTSADLPPTPATVPYDRFSSEWRRADNMEKVAHRMKMLWDLLNPQIDDAFGMAVGPSNFIIEGTPEHDQFRVLSNEQGELLYHHLSNIGAMIEELLAAYNAPADMALAA